MPATILTFIWQLSVLLPVRRSLGGQGVEDSPPDEEAGASSGSPGTRKKGRLVFPDLPLLQVAFRR